MARTFVAVQVLRNSPKARREFERALEEFSRGRPERALTRLSHTATTAAIPCEKCGLEDCEEALRIDPDFYLAHSLTGDIHLHGRDPVQAEAAYRLGYIYLAQGDYAGALQGFECFVQTNRDMDTAEVEAWVLRLKESSSEIRTASKAADP